MSSMKEADFDTGAKLLLLCEEKGISLAEAMQRREEALTGSGRDEIRKQMRQSLDVMRRSVSDGLKGGVRSASGLSGGDAGILMRYSEGRTFLGKSACRALASAIAVVEVNASMGLIVAAPTAGASGILPGVIIAFAEDEGWTEDQLIDALFTAGAVGMLIARNATVSGADGGCQAETGAGAAMAAAALTELKGGSPEKALDAAAMTLKNVLGLVCDPVAGLVECPCIKRNALGAANAMLCADMALSGIKSLIPFDEVVETMLRVGRSMPPALRETAKGGLAATKTAKLISERLREARRNG